MSTDPMEIYGDQSKEDLIGRIVELECAIAWWLNDHMKNYNEKQYGKANMRKMLKLFPNNINDRAKDDWITGPIDYERQYKSG